nr:hypothetical protein [Clostridia bacterium]
ISLVLCLLLAAGLLPASAFAATVVSSVQVNIARPFADDTPSHYVTCWNADAYKATSVDWYDDTAGRYLEGSDKCVKGHRYTAQIYLQTKAGYEFSFDGKDLHVSGRVNYQAAQVSKGFELDNEHELVLSYQFSPAEVPITDVRIGVPEFADGEKFIDNNRIVMDPDVYFGTSRKFTLDTSARDNFYNGVAWYDLTAHKYMNTADTYVYGHKYRVSIAMKPFDSYAENGFYTGTDGSYCGIASVNEKYATASSPTAHDTKSIIVSYTFPDICPKVITSIEITGIIEPVAGETPIYTASVPADSGYRISTYSEGAYLNGISWYNSVYEFDMTPEKEFWSGSSYLATVIIEPAERAVFDPALATSITAASINGRICPFEIVGGKAFVRCAFPTKPNYVYSVSLQGIQAPEAGAKPSTFKTSSIAASGDENKYHVSIEKWHNDTDDVDMGFDDSFYPGKTYTVKIPVYSDYSYGVFDESVTANMDGFPWEVVWDSSTKIYLVHTYTVEKEYETRAEFTVTVPQNGMTPDFTPEAAEGLYIRCDLTTADHFISGVAWYDETDSAWLTDADTFTYGHVYTVYIRTETTALREFTVDGAESSVKAKINGETAGINSGADPANSITLVRTFDPCGGILVDTVDPMVSGMPMPGSYPDYTVMSWMPGYEVATDAEGYTNGVLWWNSTLGEAMDSGDVFEAGSAYELYVVLKASDGYEFKTKDGTLLVDAYVSGMPASAIVYAGNDPKEYLIVKLDFPTIDYTIISEVAVDIAGFTAPVHGEEAPYMPTCSGGCQIYSEPSDVGYENGVSWVDVTAGNTFLTDGDRFMGGHTYKLYLQVWADSLYGFRFDKNTILSLNYVRSDTDPMAELWLDGDILYYSTVFECPAVEIDTVEVIGAEELTLGMTTQSGVITGAGVPALDAMKYNIIGQEPWYDETYAREISWDEDFEFERGYTYTLKVVLEAADGYVFPSPVDSVNATVNGEPAASAPSVEYGEDGKHMTVWRSMTCAEIIGAVEATVTEPAVGALPDGSCVLPDDAAYDSYGAMWLDEKGNMVPDDAPFETGRMYTVRITLEPKSTAYRFDMAYDEEYGMLRPVETFVAMVNGESAELLPSVNPNAVIVEHTFKPAGLTEIDTVSITGPLEPRVGDTPAFSAMADDDSYTVGTMRWFNEDDSELPADYEYEDGHPYTLYVELQAKDGYAFRTTYDKGLERYEYGDMMLLINSEYALPGAPTGTDMSLVDQRYTLWMKYVFVLNEAATRITMIEAYNLAKPVAGEEAVFAPPLMPTVDSVHYKLFDTDENGFVHGTCWYWYDDDEKVDDWVAMEEGDIFLPGHEYKLSVWLEAVPDYSFWTVILGYEVDGIMVYFPSMNAEVYMNGEYQGYAKLPEGDKWKVGQYAIANFYFDPNPPKGRGGTLRDKEKNRLHWMQEAGADSISVFGSVYESMPALVASYDADGRFLGLQVLTEDTAAVELKDGAAVTEVFWVDENCAPKSEPAEVPAE